MIIEIALGILLAFAILATAVIWIPLVAGAAVLAAIAGIGYAVYLYPMEFLFPVSVIVGWIGGIVLLAWLNREITRYFERRKAQ